MLEGDVNRQIDDDRTIMLCRSLCREGCLGKHVDRTDSPTIT